MKIAIIGSGITGNAAAWLLNEKHDITIYEKNSYIGGHSNTVEAIGYPAVDTGFIVYNEWTYPNLIALFDHLGVKTQMADMSFGVSINRGTLEYGSNALFAQKRNLLSLKFYRMIWDILRFYREAPKDVKQEKWETKSLGDYLDHKRYSIGFIEDHILPMAAAIWSNSMDDVRDFPVQSFINFFINHGLFKIINRPQWYTVTGGSREYVKTLTAAFKHKIKTDIAVTSVTSAENKVLVEDDTGGKEIFDHVIMACHADQSLALLKDANTLEKELLKAFPYEPNKAYLHTDKSFMPRKPKAWSSWNYLSPSDNKVVVTYWMNMLQEFLPKTPHLFVTLNPDTPPAKDKIVKVINYEHPHFGTRALNGWSKIKTIQGKRNIWFCGAWCGYGFHEDGISAGLAVAESISGLKRPWKVTDKSPAGKNCTPEKGKN